MDSGEVAIRPISQFVGHIAGIQNFGFKRLLHCAPHLNYRRRGAGKPKQQV